MLFHHNFMRINSPGRPWILTLGVGALMVRFGNYQRAIWWRGRELYNSWAKYRVASADTHPQGGDVEQAPSPMSGAVAEGETPKDRPTTYRGGRQ